MTCLNKICCQSETEEKQRNKFICQKRRAWNRTLHGLVQLKISEWNIRFNILYLSIWIDNNPIVMDSYVVFTDNFVWLAQSLD